MTNFGHPHSPRPARSHPYPPVTPGAHQLLVAANNLGVMRNDRWLVRDIDLAIHAGEIVTIIGPNGGGKTTTAKALLGLVKINAGTITREPDIKVGYVPQKFAIDWSLPLPVWRLMRLTQTYSDPQVRSALEMVGASHLYDREVWQLSGGELQRVLLARAIAGTPNLLVLDEPVQGVDFTGEIELYELIRDIRDRLQCGVLLISHDLHIVMADTDTVVCINGHVCCSGAPGQVVSNEAYKQLFGARGRPALAIYEHVHDHTHDHDHDHGHNHNHNHAHNQAPNQADNDADNGVRASDPSAQKNDGQRPVGEET